MKEPHIIRGGPLDGTVIDFDPDGETPDPVREWHVADGPSGGTALLEPAEPEKQRES
jgi:hypothetical protein